MTEPAPVGGDTPTQSAAAHRGRLLLIAYEYPPVLSAHSIRWYYLSAELARCGWQVDVVTVDLEVPPDLALPVPEGVSVYRSFAGPYVGLASKARRSAGQSAGEGDATSGPSIAERLYRIGRRILDNLLLPDVRVEWYYFARAEIHRLCRQHQYHCVIGSHEPAVDLMLALPVARKYGLPAIADCGDPVATVYTPRWRYRLDYWLERHLLTGYDSVVATTAQARGELIGRHPALTDKVHVIPQGTSVTMPRPPSERASQLAQTLHKRFTLLYTGNFYADFRNPRQIYRALERCEEVSLLVVGCAGEDLLGGRVRFVPRLGHFDCLFLQRHCSALLALGNRQKEQTPGKVFEYLGACRPVLYVYQEEDYGAEVVQMLNRGICVANDERQIADALETLQQMQRGGTEADLFDLGAGCVAPWEWSTLAGNYSALLTGLAVASTNGP